MGRAPNEMPGRPGPKVVPVWSGNDDAASAQRRRATVEWRREHPRGRGWLGRMLRRRSRGA